MQRGYRCRLQAVRKKVGGHLGPHSRQAAAEGFPCASRSQALAHRTTMMRRALAEQWALEDKIGLSFRSFGECIVASRLLGAADAKSMAEYAEACADGNWARHRPRPGHCGPPPPPPQPAGAIKCELLEQFREDLARQTKVVDTPTADKEDTDAEKKLLPWLREPEMKEEPAESAIATIDAMTSNEEKDADDAGVAVLRCDDRNEETAAISDGETIAYKMRTIPWTPLEKGRRAAPVPAPLPLSRLTTTSRILSTRRK